MMKNWSHRNMVASFDIRMNKENKIKWCIIILISNLILLNIVNDFANPKPRWFWLQTIQAVGSMSLGKVNRSSLDQILMLACTHPIHNSNSICIIFQRVSFFKVFISNSFSYSNHPCHFICSLFISWIHVQPFVILSHWLSLSMHHNHTSRKFQSLPCLFHFHRCLFSSHSPSPMLSVPTSPSPLSTSLPPSAASYQPNKQKESHNFSTRNMPLLIKRKKPWNLPGFSYWGFTISDLFQMSSLVPIIIL